jgi:hypothetical protein
VTLIEPGAVSTELPQDITHAESEQLCARLAKSSDERGPQTRSITVERDP